MPDSWSLVTPSGAYQLNPSFAAPQYEPGGVGGPGALRRDERTTYQRSGDGLRTPGPLTLVGRVWRDDHNQALMVAELNDIRAAVSACTQVVRTNNAGSYTYDFLAGGATPEVTPDGLGGWVIEIELWPGRPDVIVLPPVPPPPTGEGLIGNVNQIGSNINISWQMGWAFKPTQNLSAIALRARMDAGGTEIARLWRASDAAELAATSILPSDSMTWVESSIAPVTLLAGVEYVVAVRRDDGAARPIRLTHVNNIPWSGLATYIGARYINGVGYPSNPDGTDYAYGLVDVIVVPL